MLRKKALNSNFNWGPLHGEIRLLKYKKNYLLFFPIFSKGIKAKLNDLESESDIFPQTEGKVGKSELTPVVKAPKKTAVKKAVKKYSDRFTLIGTS